MLVAIIVLELLVASFWYCFFFLRKESATTAQVTDRRQIEQYQMARSSSSSCSRF